MDKFSLMVPNFLPSGEYFHPKKNKTCIGCGVSLAVRLVGKAAGALLEKAACERTSGKNLLGVQTEAALLKMKHGKSELIICLDDEPSGKLDDAVKKNLPSIAVAEGFGYVATACPSYAFDLLEKVNRALEVQGRSYIHILCPCPSGWLYSSEDTVKMGFWAVESLAFPLYEVAGGYTNLTIKTLKPRKLADYITAQGRFEKVTDKQLTAAGAIVEKQYGKLLESIQPAA